MILIATVGTREYCRQRGFQVGGLYMVRDTRQRPRGLGNTLGLRCLCPPDTPTWPSCRGPRRRLRPDAFSPELPCAGAAL